MLTCPEESCVVNTQDETPQFNITVTVSRARVTTESLFELDAEHFECVHCGSKAEEEDE